MSCLLIYSQCIACVVTDGVADECKKISAEMVDIINLINFAALKINEL